MDAVLAIMAKSGRAIIFIFRDADRNKLISYSLYKFILNPSTSATSNPLRRGSRGWGVFIYGNHAARRENGTSWWGCLCDVCLASKKSSEREFFVVFFSDFPLKNMIDGNLVFPVPPDDIIKKGAYPASYLLW
jgi:hypothetical protein